MLPVCVTQPQSPNFYKFYFTCTFALFAPSMYSLEKGSKKYPCPKCNKRTWVRYIDSEDLNTYLPDKYGRCDRETKCGNYLNPYNDNYLNGSEISFNPIKVWKPPKKNSTVFIPEEVLELTFEPKGYQRNKFLQNLLERVPFPFDVSDVEQVINQYYLGTICKGYRAGAVTFPFIDINDNVRTIQVKEFDETNHTVGTDFLHSLLKNDKSKPEPNWLTAYLKNDSFVSCLFGEHLLNRYPLNPVALVEAPKTAIYGTLYYGQPDNPSRLLWLAVYNLSSLNFAKCKALANRNVILFPDLSKDGSAFKLWSERAESLASQINGSTFLVSDLLELNATHEEKEKGMDFADFLILNDWREFRTQDRSSFKIEILPETFPEILIPARECKKCKGDDLQQQFQTRLEEVNDQFQGENELVELKLFFKNTVLPGIPIKLDQSSIITDVSGFVESSLACIKAHKGEKIFLPYLNRLKQVRNIL